MTNHFEYKGYLGSAEVDIEGGILAGKLLFIRDVIAYSATTPAKLEKAFREAVDEYLRTCEELRDEPDTPCKGSFNVRVGPELHRDAALAARAKGMGLNEFVCQALAAAVQDRRPERVEHVHQVFVHAGGQTETFVTSTQPAELRATHATH
jgi:predicted HicB family RNase H-like nuclease